MTRGEYLENAEQCMQLAQRAKEPQRSKLVHLANAWLDLAGEDVPLVPSAQDEGDDDYEAKPKAAKR